MAKVIDYARAKREYPAVETLLWMFLVAMAPVYGSFVYQLAVIAGAVLIAWRWFSPWNKRIAWASFATFVLSLSLSLTPVDLAFRNGDQFGVCIADVWYGPRGFGPAPTTGRSQIRYRGDAICVKVRWALLVTLPTRVQVETPLRF